MRAIKDLMSGQKPTLIDLPYNGTVNADSVTKRYKGSLVKHTDFDNADGRKEQDENRRCGKTRFEEHYLRIPMTAPHQRHGCK